ncbi:MAG: hypothetical protein ACETWQ_10315, partial [Phycisphaerae bacterium]
PNLVRRRRIANVYDTMTYENNSDWTLGENKPNSNPNKPNLVRRRRIANVYDTKDYRKNDVFVVRINKPNFRNGQNERKLTYNKGLRQCYRLQASKKQSQNKANSNLVLSAVEWANLNWCCPWDSLRRTIDGFENFSYCTEQT